MYQKFVTVCSVQKTQNNHRPNPASILHGHNHKHLLKLLEYMNFI